MMKNYPKCSGKFGINHNLIFKYCHNADGSSAYKFHVYNYSHFNSEFLLPIILKITLNWQYKYYVDKSYAGVS